MGGSPENLQFLSQLLSRHHNLYLDSSATKWIVREISKHEKSEVHAFFEKWTDRLLFGSDIVTSEEHVSGATQELTGREIPDKEEAAYELYASRYWALRTLWETSKQIGSPIADPDLHMVDPDRFSPLDSPFLAGKELPITILENFYSNLATKLFV
jgi:hypothetical protein